MVKLSRQKNPRSAKAIQNFGNNTSTKEKNLHLCPYIFVSVCLTFSIARALCYVTKCHDTVNIQLHIDCDLTFLEKIFETIQCLQTFSH